jgi:hypothetical protein
LSGSTTIRFEMLWTRIFDEWSIAASRSSSKGTATTRYWQRDYSELWTRRTKELERNCSVSLCNHVFNTGWRHMSLSCRANTRSRQKLDASYSNKR